MRLAAALSASRSLLVQQNTHSLPLPFVGVVVMWLAVIFGSFGLFAPRNTTTVVALFFSVLAVSMAFKLLPTSAMEKRETQKSRCLCG